jgi:hypothetical protein
VGGKVGAVEVVSPRPLGGPRREGERNRSKRGSGTGRREMQVGPLGRVRERERERRLGGW